MSLNTTIDPAKLGVKLEICANSLRSAVAAERGGASRIELCSNLEQGGITPSYGLIKLVVEKLSIPVHVLIRPRPGNFVYNEDHLSIMRSDVGIARELGAQGVVLGVLTEDSQVNVPVCKELMEVAGGMDVTFHRAFDDCVDQEKALEDVIGLGCNRILTSGGKERAIDGELRIRRMIKKAGNRIVIMPGAGITTENLQDIWDRSDASELHTSAGRYFEPTEEQLKQSMFAVATRHTDEKIVRQMIEMLQGAKSEKPNLHPGHPNS